MQQVHLCLLNGPATLAMVTVRAGCYQVIPAMLTPKVAWNDVVNGKISDMLPAILASVVITPQDLPLGQLDLRAWTVDHLFEANNGWARVDLPNSLDLAASIKDQAGFSINDKRDGTAGIADVDRLKISV